MPHNLSTIVKSYDVRGTYPDQIDAKKVAALGRAFATWLNASAIAVGRDCRSTSPELHAALIDGITSQGTDVYDIGECTTPMLYFASGNLQARLRRQVDGAVMVTASHNPPQYNGLKFTRAEAVPIGLDSGLRDIKEIAEKESFHKSARTGEVHSASVTKPYHDKIASLADFQTTPLHVVIDPANMVGALDVPLFHSFSPHLTTTTIYDDIDGSMPNHEANPLNKDTLKDLANAVTEHGAHLGIAYDGDGDRIGFVDEAGTPVPPHLITALLARDFLTTHPGATIAYDVPSSRSVKIEIEKHGGTPLLSKVGTAHVKSAMREKKAVFGGEFSGHHYFHDHHYSEAPSRVAILVMNMIAREKKALSELIASVQHYHHSGEMNFELAPETDKQAVLDHFKATYYDLPAQADSELTDIDGIRIDYDDWWFLIRPSNTEPLMRMVAEAKTPERLQEKIDELQKKLREID